jgi:hypothetical protein
MSRGSAVVCGFALAVGLTLPATARAGDVRLTIRDGRVALSAHDASLRQILIEWERVGGTRVFNRDRVSATPVTIELVDVPEAQALAALLRPIAGYVTALRLDPSGGASRYSRIILMPGEAAPWAGAGAVAAQPAGPSGPVGPSGLPGGGPFGRGPGARRVLPDGRIVPAGDDSGRPPDADDSDDNVPQPTMMRPPFGAPGRMQQSTADEPAQVDTPSSPASGPFRSSPGAAVTITTPGSVPAVKQLSATPVKPPGD